MKNIFFCLLVLCAFAVQSCKKETAIDSIQQPVDTTQETGGADSSFLPRSITVASPDFEEGSLTVGFKYLPDVHQIKIYLDDTLTADPYDKLVLTYFYNNDGYFIKREGYDATGSINSTLSVERSSDNTLKTLIAWEKDTVLHQTSSDTFAVSFSDSGSFKIMTVDNTVYFPSDAVKVRNKLTFLNNQLLEESGGQFTGQSSSIGRPALVY